jgi:hypothetical protein
MGVGATAIVVAFAVEFGISLSFWDAMFAAWQTLPVVLAALLLRERVMHPLTAIIATMASVSLTLLEIFTLDLTSSSTAAIGVLFIWFYPAIVVSLCLLLQVSGTSVVARIRSRSETL